MNSDACSHSCHGCGSSSDSGGCGGGCGACCGGGGVLILCREEADILLHLGQYAFLPILQKSQKGDPVFFPIPEDRHRFSEDFSPLIFSLAKKKLISIDPDIPVTGADYGQDIISPYDRRGSIALTLQGQEALDWLSDEFD